MRKLSLLLMTLLLFVGFSAQAFQLPNDPFGDKPFISWYADMAGKIKNDASYHPLPLDTKEQAGEFVEWLHDVYRLRITPAQFESKVAEKYPGHDGEARFILGLMPPPDQRPER